MKNFKRSIPAILLIFLILLSSFIPSYANEAAVSEYASTYSVSSYSKEYNSGTRGDVCTTLAGTSAAAYYQNYIYDDLSALSSAALFTELQTLMRTTHTYTSSYDDCHYKANQTDCQNEDGSVSLIYTGYSATMSQWNGWNREHVWPQSLGGGNTSGGGGDMHHIRPSDSGVNSSRGNKKYGNAGAGATSKYGSDPAVGVLGGTYNSTYFEPLDNVKGDVARICLYVYVRWNSSWSATDITDVFESVDVLLAWCELDPVDTWEMGRNEVVGAIQGNRNVFIDYPEYAWLLFGKDVPGDMVTPSGEASNGTATGGGSTGGDSSGDSSDPEIEVPTTGSATLTFDNTSKRTSFSTSAQVWEENGITFTNSKTSGSNNVADYSNPIRLYKSSSVTIESQSKIQKIEFVCNSSDYASELKSSIGSEATVNGNTVTVILTTPATSYTIASLTAQIRLNSLTVYYESNDSEPCDHINQTTTVTNATCAIAGSIKTTCNDCGATLSTTSVPATGHQNTSTVTIPATCTEAGSTTVTCDDCKATVSSAVIDALGHSYVGGVCENCGVALSTYTCTFVHPEGSLLITGTPVIIPGAPTLNNSYKQSYTFVGWVANEVEDTTSSPTIYYEGDELELTGNTTLYALYSYETEGAAVTNGYVEKSIANITSTDVVIITMTTSNGTVYALTSANGTGSAPTAIVITVNGSTIKSNIADELKWNISNSNGSLTIYPNGTTAKWLYCTSTNNGVRIGTNANKTFTIDTASGYLKNTATNRYVGVYTTNPDWRCYTNTTGNTANQTLKFYVESKSGGAVTHYTTELECDCTHENTTTNTVSATCTVAGSIIITCNDCGVTVSTRVVPATGHQNTHTVTVSATCTENGSVTVICDDCGATVSTSAITATGHSLDDGVCLKCGYIESSSSGSGQNGWVLVTDASTLKAGDKIIIVSGTFAAGNISNSIMASLDGVTVADNTITTLPDGAVILTLGGSSGAWTLSNKDGKLLGATAVKKLAWGSGTTTWSISISEGLATIQNSNSSYGRFLYNVTSPRFTTYTSNTSTSMLLPAIYRYEESGPSESEGVKIQAASMTVGTTLAMNYYVSGHDAGKSYYMVFTMNGNSYVFENGVEKNGYLVFSFTNIPPQYMGDNICASLYASDDEIPVFTIERYSAKAYIEKVIQSYSSNEKLMNLVTDVLRYGAAAQMYRSYKTDALVTENLETNGVNINDFGSNAVPSIDDNDRSIKTEDNTSSFTDTFTALGVRFDYDNKIYFKLKSDDISKIRITVTVNGNETDITDSISSSGDGTYVYYTESISAKRFSDVFTFKMYVGGELHQTLTYSVNSYIYAKCGDLNTTDESTLTALAQLVRALYRYGLSAEAYV